MENVKPNTSRKRFWTANYNVDQSLIIWFRQYYFKPDLRIDGEMLILKDAYSASQVLHGLKGEKDAGM